MLSPIEIQKKEFRRSFRGYSEEEVKSFLEKISIDYEKIYKQNQDLKEEIASLKEKIQEYREMESTLKNALLLAQKTVEDTKKNAMKEKEIILKEAMTKAEKIIDKAEKKYVVLNSRYEDLRMQFNLFKTRFTNFLQSQIELVNSFELNDMNESPTITDSLEQVAASSDEKEKGKNDLDLTDANVIDEQNAANSSDVIYIETGKSYGNCLESQDDAAASGICGEDTSKDEESE